MKHEEARKIADGTRKTYDTAADEFSASRAKFWDELAFLAKHIKTGDRVLDIGCGNGRFFPLVTERGARYTGVDYSGGLIREAKRLHPEGEFIVGDATALLFPDESFDIAYSFAVIHHIPGDELRALFVREARRVLRPNGTLVLTTWDLWSPRHIGTLLANVAKNLLRFAPTNIKDIFLPLGKDHTLRYIHAFTRQELSALLAKNGFTVVNIEIIPHGKKESNIVVVAKRT